MKAYKNGISRVLTPEEIAAWETACAQPVSPPMPEERIQRLEETKAEQSDVEELQEALDMILNGVTE